MKPSTIIILALFLLNLAVIPAESKNSTAKNKSPKLYKLDLDKDGLKEIITVEDEFDAGQEFVITVMNQNKKDEIDSFSIQGRFKKIEFIDLDGDGYKQIAIRYKDEIGYENLAIYQLKDENLFKIFSVGSIYGIDTDFGSTLARVKVGRSRCTGRNCYSGDVPDWEIWVWGGEKFIRER